MLTTLQNTLGAAYLGVVASAMYAPIDTTAFLFSLIADFQFVWHDKPAGVCMLSTLPSR